MGLQGAAATAMAELQGDATAEAPAGQADTAGGTESASGTESAYGGGANPW
jgi:hypothetical protein